MTSWKKNGYRRTNTDTNGNRTQAVMYRKRITNSHVERLINSIFKKGGSNV